jgi:hypothetical protein
VLARRQVAEASPHPDPPGQAGESRRRYSIFWYASAKLSSESGTVTLLAVVDLQIEAGR